MASVDAFLKLDGIKGESTDKSHKDEIEIMSLSWGVHSSTNIGEGGGGGVGKGVFSDFAMQKKVDLASPKLALLAGRGEHIKSGKISIRKAGGAANQVDYQIYDLEKIYVTGVNISGGPDGQFYETLTLAATKFKWEYKQQGDDGSLKGSMACTIDRAANVHT